MGTRAHVTALLGAGHSYETAARALGIPAGQASMIATGLPADGGDVPPRWVVKSVCPDCAVGCAQNVFVKDDRVVQIEGDPDAPHSRGRLCPSARRRCSSPRAPPARSTSCWRAGEDATVTSRVDRSRVVTTGSGRSP